MKHNDRRVLFSVFAKDKPRGDKGFTLIEALVALFILVILIGILLAAVVNVRTILQTGDIMALLQSDARLAMNAIANELRRTSRSQITIIQNDPMSGSDSITYHVPLDSDGDGQPDLDGSGYAVWDATNFVLRRDPAQLPMLRKEDGGATNLIIGRNVRKINFIDQAIDAGLYPDEIRVVLELEKSDVKGTTYSTVLTSEINMRN